MDTVELSGLFVGALFVISFVLWAIVLFSKYKKIGNDLQKNTLYLLAVLLGPVPVVGIITNSFALCKL